MEMKNYIEEGAKKAGSNKELAKFLGQSQSILSDVKAGKRGLPVVACTQLAEFIGIDPIKVIMASELTTEKDEKKRKILESCFQKVASFAAIAVVTSIVTLSMASPVHAGLSDSTINNTNYWQLNVIF